MKTSFVKAIIALLASAIAFLAKAQDVPNFNYPQTVMKTADKKLNQAIEQKNGPDVVKYLIQGTIAEAQISSDYTPRILNKIDSVAALAPDDASRGLTHYLKAVVYNSYYENNWYEISRRLAIDTRADDISEWTGDDFAAAITECMRQALAYSDALFATPVTLYTEADELSAAIYPTMLDVLTYRGAEMLRQEYDGTVLGSEAQQQARQLADEALAQLLQRHQGNAGPYITASLAAADEPDKETAKALYEQFKADEYGFIALKYYIRLADDDKEKYALLNDYLSRFPKGMFSPNARNALAVVTQKAVTLQFANSCTTADSLTVEVRGENVNQCRVLVYRVPDDVELDDRLLRKNFGKLQMVASATARLQGAVPFADTATVKLPPLTYGRYIVLPEYDGKVQRKDIYPREFRVTDISLFYTKDKGGVKVFAVDAITGKPIEGAYINRTSKYDLPRAGRISTNRTNADGYCLIKDDDDRMDRSVAAVKGGDQYGNGMYISKFGSYEPDAEAIEVMTDLAVYRPGDTVQYAAIGYRLDRNSRQLITHLPVTVALYDSNMREIATDSLVTDEMGRVQGQFVIPTDRMNGRFLLEVESKSARGVHYVTVSEYKAPTFFVEFDGEQHSYARGADVTITGRASYFTGVPVADATVAMKLNYQEWNWWYRGRGNATHITDFEVKTNAEGRFTATIPSSDLSEEDALWCRQFVLDASVTDQAGETHSASNIFWLGTARSIQASGSDFTFEVSGGTVQLPLNVYSSDPSETSLTCHYSIGTLSGTFPSDEPKIGVTSLKSGEYELKVWLDDTVKFSTQVVLFRKGDAMPPVQSPMWIPQCMATVGDDNRAQVLIGTTKAEAYIYCIAATRKGVIKETWLRYSAGMHTLALDIPKEEDEYVDLTLITVSNGQVMRWNKRFNSVANVKKLEIKPIAFRDMLVPGAPETWTFQLTDQDGKPWRGAMICDMYDKALDMIERHGWGFAPKLSLPRLYSTGFNDISNLWLRSSLPWTAEKTKNAQLPDLDFYGRSYGGNIYVRSSSMRMYNLAAPAFAADEETEACYDVMSVEAKQETVVEDAGGAESEMTFDEKALENVQLRTADIQNALWLPSLTADEQGRVSITFNSPNFNTTWLFKAIAYTTDLHTATMVQEVVTRKPIMVRAALPRFVRNGDKARLSAVLQNATDTVQRCSAIVELFDIATGEVVKQQQYSVELEASGSASLDIDWSVPTDISLIGYRVKAANSNFGDGEQRMLPVLPAVSPVIETEPFYITDGGTFEVSMNNRNQGRMTLEYCNNPVWYCVTALPSIKQDDYTTANGLVHSLYAIAVAQGVAQSNPRIKPAIGRWLAREGDSTLVSNLAKNQDLKIGTLLASPWINEADRQTARMQSIGELFDSTAVAAETETIIAKLRELQMSDGGFTWLRYSGCRSSQWVTMEVLELFGELHHLGYLTDNADIDAMARKAVAYMDRETVKSYNEMRDKSNLSGFYGYAYVRSLFPQYPLTGQAQDLFKRIINYMAKNWEKATGLSDKAFCAMTLQRNGEGKTARHIMASVLEYSISSPNGRYWDNFSNGSDRGSGRVAVTATLLQAFAEVTGNDLATIDAIRQWMLLQKQANDWGNYSMAADAVYSILSTGTEWLGDQPAPAISLNGEPLEYEPDDITLGYFRRQLSGDHFDLAIDRRGAVSPAWGAIYCQYQAPMTDIKAVKIDDLSIEKQICRLDGGRLDSRAKLAVGDRVMVRLVIKNSREMQFVTVNDERAACCEPTDQTSGYCYADGLGYYLETKDSATRLFFDYLPKGTHIVTYEVTITSPGSYNMGIATAQSQYAPQLTAHSAGAMLNINCDNE